ncbi:hypothetical protein CVT24_010466 [Panaeolus cyanescens]|uniref:Uncharacterized protein n=1 Tax=Panaeolus cyanescens TaxID=181874 RepID=A0A409W981_9AGAR|nr:hypothetical protein CVT24_010466 [Panaeolus cyanescens]
MPKVKTERRTAEPQLPLQHKAFSSETPSSGFRVKTEETDDEHDLRVQLARRHALPPATSASLNSGQASINDARVKNEVSDKQDFKLCAFDCLNLFKPFHPSFSPANMPRVQKEHKTAAERHAVPSKESPSAESMTDVLVKCDLSVEHNLKPTLTRHALHHFATSSRQTSFTLNTGSYANSGVSDGQESEESESELSQDIESEWTNSKGADELCIKPGKQYAIHHGASTSLMDEEYLEAYLTGKQFSSLEPEVGLTQDNPTRKVKKPPQNLPRKENIFRSQKWVADRIVKILERCGVQCALVDDMAQLLFGMKNHKCRNIILAVYPSDGRSQLEVAKLKRRVVEEDPTCFAMHTRKADGTSLAQLFCNPPEAIRQTMDFVFFVSKAATRTRRYRGYEVRLVVPCPNTAILPYFPVQHIIWIDGFPVLSFAFILLRQVFRWHEAYRSNMRCKRLLQKNRADMLHMLLNSTTHIEPLCVTSPWTSQPPLISPSDLASVKQQIATFIKCRAGASTKEAWIKLGLA